MKKNEKKVTQLTVEELKIIIDDIIDEKLLERFEDPDAWLEVRPEIIEKLKAQRKSRRKGISGVEIAKKYGINLKE